MKILCAKLDANIRYRLRICIWKHWKTPQNRAKNLMKLDELEEMDRTIMTMFGDGATEKQIAEVVHLSQKGVNKRKKKVMVQLKTRLKDFE